MPASTQGNFQKSIFTDTFKQKINLDKSSIKKINNLCNSNSSRYLSSKNLNKNAKSPNKKLGSKKSQKNLIPSALKIKSPIKINESESRSTHKIKNQRIKIGESGKINKQKRTKN